MRNHPYKLYGATMIVVIAGLVALSILFFNRTFTSTVPVTLHVPVAGLQLLPGSDVKVRGIIVGQVSSITSNGRGATIHLELEPGKAKELPANVSVRLTPKTIFGEKQIDLLLPAHPSGRLQAGSVIQQDRSARTLEIDQALNDLLPLLRTVQPAQLNETLTAIATALSGRGQELGQIIEQGNAYLKRFDPNLPLLRTDLSELSGVTRTYNEAAPALLRLLRNTTVTASTITDEKQQLSALLDDVAGTADATHDLLARNAQNIVQVNRLNRGTIALLARYSPEFPCFFKGSAKLIPNIHGAIQNKPGVNRAAHVVIEFVPSYPTYQYPIDLPEFTEDRGPHCYGLPNPPFALPRIRFKDGTEDDPRFDAVGGSQPAHGSPFSPTSMGTAAMGDAGTSREQQMLNSLLGPILQTPAAQIPDIADLLWGPVVRGTAVSLR